VSAAGVRMRGPSWEEWQTCQKCRHGASCSSRVMPGSSPPPPPPPPPPPSFSGVAEGVLKALWRKPAHIIL